MCKLQNLNTYNICCEVAGVIHLSPQEVGELIWKKHKITIKLDYNLDEPPIDLRHVIDSHRVAERVHIDKTMSSFTIGKTVTTNANDVRKAVVELIETTKESDK